MNNEGVAVFTAHCLQGRRLELDFLLRELQHDGFIGPDDAERCCRSAQIKRGMPHHPLALIGALKIEDRRALGGVISLEDLTSWVAAKSGLPYQHIDPLKLEVHAITNLNLPLAYLERFNIMPIKVASDRVVMATAEPFIDEWVKELSQVLKKKIERVIVNPLDIQRYRREFFALAESVKGASDGRVSTSQISDFEQLVTLGRAGRLDASDQHIVHIVDWLLQYAFDQRASDIHLEPRRESANIRFRIDGAVSRIHVSENDVFFHGCIVTQRFLEHDGHEPPQFFFAYITNVYSIQGYTTLVRIVQPAEKLEQRALSCAVGAHYRYQPAGGNIDIEVTQGRSFTTGIAEGDIIETNSCLE